MHTKIYIYFTNSSSSETIANPSSKDTGLYPNSFIALSNKKPVLGGRLAAWFNVIDFIGDTLTFISIHKNQPHDTPTPRYSSCPFLIR